MTKPFQNGFKDISLNYYFGLSLFESLSVGYWTVLQKPWIWRSSLKGDPHRRLECHPWFKRKEVPTDGRSRTFTLKFLVYRLGKSPPCSRTSLSTRTGSTLFFERRVLVSFGSPRSRGRRRFVHRTPVLSVIMTHPFCRLWFTPSELIYAESVGYLWFCWQILSVSLHVFRYCVTHFFRSIFYYVSLLRVNLYLW